MCKHIHVCQHSRCIQELISSSYILIIDILDQFKPSMSKKDLKVCFWIFSFHPELLYDPVLATEWT